ncbi:ArdC-like ssDNA-binding domain-containing protein [Nocardioides sp. S5]|uniref:ArdC-like ssDNA-binding domain-containing protein n=1 Tax=Nocardioides sp. S5 TaxID=2017486 RepID=UPI001F5D3F58|nr:ArdC-like ssDNA-binding domain-containing protein [Nocardioides sp. S5]
MTTQVRGRAAREAKLEALQEQLSESVAALVTGEDWKRALTFAAQFRGRSFGNSMLIAAQHFAACEEGRVPEPTPTYVAGFHQWLSLGRSVAKGQHGYGILAPVTGRFASFTPDDPNSWRRLARNEKPMSGEYARTRMIGVKPTYVWDISQTTGDPVPELPRPSLLQGQAPAGLWDGLADQITAAGFELRLVSSAAAIGGANGLTDFLSREVTIRMDMDESAQVKTLAHELGHVLLHAPPETALSTQSAADATLHRGIAEVEAESVALTLIWTASGGWAFSGSSPTARRRGVHESSSYPRCRRSGGPARRRGRDHCRCGDRLPSLPDGTWLLAEHRAQLRLRPAAPVAVPRPLRNGLGRTASTVLDRPADIPPHGADEITGTAAVADCGRTYGNTDPVSGDDQQDLDWSRWLLRVGDRD